MNPPDCCALPVAEQLVFELSTPDPPSFGNFLAGRNAEAVAAVKALAAGEGVETCVVLWGASGAGKSHLLRAATDAAGAKGDVVARLSEPDELLAHDLDSLLARAFVAIDNIDRATPDVQARIFSLFNGLRERGGRLLVAARTSLAVLPLREDLRTRLGWGLVYELTALSDADKPVALAAFAKARGLPLTDDVIAYLLAHGRRDMPALLATIGALDRHSLAIKRAITVPMLRDWLQRDILEDGNPASS